VLRVISRRRLLARARFEAVGAAASLAAAGLLAAARRLATAGVLAAAALAAPASCARAPDLETVRRYEEANRRLLETKDADGFLQAAALYEQVLARGGENGAVLHALGNAWFKAGRKGAAIASWRRALVHRPRDPFLRANLAHALGHDPEEGETSLLRTLLFWQDDLSYGEKARVLSVGVLLACAAFALARLSRRARRFAGPACGVFAVVAALAAASFAMEVRDREFRVRGVVNAPEVVARKGNAESFEPAFNEPLSEGAEVEVLEQRGEWLRVSAGGGLEGWVRADAVARW
jgi:tetratricopeptide (TPR) repeat protein